MKVQVCVQVYRSKRFSITNKGLALLDSGSICALLKMILEFWEPFQWDPFWLNILIHPADVISMFSFPLPWWQLPEVLSIGCGCQRQEGPFALQEDSHFDLSASQNKVPSSNFSTSCNIGLMQLIVYSLTRSLRWVFDSFRPEKHRRTVCVIFLMHKKNQQDQTAMQSVFVAAKTKMEHEVW